MGIFADIDHRCPKIEVLHLQELWGTTGHRFPCEDGGLREECWRLCCKGDFHGPALGAELLKAALFLSLLASVLHIFKFTISRISSRTTENRNRSGRGKKRECSYIRVANQSPYPLYL